jgi:sulfatase modifying factor 1
MVGTSAPTPFSYEIPPREPSEWSDWGDDPLTKPLTEPRIEIVRAIARPEAGDLDEPISSRTSVVASVPEPPLTEPETAPSPRARIRFAATLAVIAIALLGLHERTGLAKILAGIQVRTHLFGPKRVNATEPPGVVGAPPPVIGSSDPCPNEMALIERDDLRVCIDMWEASVVEIVAGGEERPYSPYLSVEGHTVMAVSKAGAVPQGYISRDEAEQACALASKRLCSNEEWKAACEGPDRTTYPYGATLEDEACNTHGKSPISELFSTYGDSVWDSRLMNDPSLNALDGTVAKTGAFGKCTNGYGVFDMVGNLHEWTADKAGVFRGGYYQDAEKNGSGCNYATGAHFPTYHDYSTGFRCCRDAD